MDTQELVMKIKKKKHLRGLPDEVVIKEIKEYSEKMDKASQKYSEREVFKAVRKKLHNIYGAFQSNRRRKRSLMLEELKIAKAENPERIKNSEEMKEIRRRMLSTSISAAERLEAGYAHTYESIKKVLDRPIRTVMDLGCGVNPIAFCPSDFEEIKVYAYDIDNDDIDFLNKYFKIMMMDGKAEVLDLHDLDKVRRLPAADVILLFKVVDPLEKKGHQFSELILSILKEKARNIVVSFATKTLSQKVMKRPQREWFERMTERIGFKHVKVETKNEIYYVLKR